MLNKDLLSWANRKIHQIDQINDLGKFVSLTPPSRLEGIEHTQEN